MPTVEIITIGTEILLGEIADTNTRRIARALRETGFDLYRTTSIGDNPVRISQAILEALERAEIVITTGGLGPTVDDPTREAVALAFGVGTVFHDHLWEQVIERFARFGRTPTENNRKQATLPEGALPLENPVGTAPGFLIESDSGVLISLPGVPSEMDYLLEHSALPYLLERFPPETVLKVRVLHTAGAGESQIDEKIHDLESLSNPTIGLAAHAGQVDVRIAAKARSEEEAQALIGSVEADLRSRLGSWVYGADDETLAGLAMRNLDSKGWSLALVEAGLAGSLVSLFPTGGRTFVQALVYPAPPEETQAILDMASGLRNAAGADVALGVGLYNHTARPSFVLALHSPLGQKIRRIPYGGPPGLAATRAANFALDWLRRLDGLTPRPSTTRQTGR
jgi:competence/damage-inducible protein CinA-like protein